MNRTSNFPKSGMILGKVLTLPTRAQQKSLFENHDDEEKKRYTHQSHFFIMVFPSKAPRMISSIHILNSTGRPRTKAGETFPIKSAEVKGGLNWIAQLFTAQPALHQGLPPLSQGLDKQLCMHKKLGIKSTQDAHRLEPAFDSGRPLSQRWEGADRNGNTEYRKKETRTHAHTHAYTKLPLKAHLLNGFTYVWPPWSPLHVSGSETPVC